MFCNFTNNYTKKKFSLTKDVTNYFEPVKEEYDKFNEELKNIFKPLVSELEFKDGSINNIEQRDSKSNVEDIVYQTVPKLFNNITNLSSRNIYKKSDFHYILINSFREKQAVINDFKCVFYRDLYKAEDNFFFEFDLSYFFSYLYKEKKIDLSFIENMAVSAIEDKEYEFVIQLSNLKLLDLTKLYFTVNDSKTGNKKVNFFEYLIYMGGDLNKVSNVFKKIDHVSSIDNNKLLNLLLENDDFELTEDILANESLVNYDVAQFSKIKEVFFNKIEQANSIDAKKLYKKYLKIMDLYEKSLGNYVGINQEDLAIDKIRNDLSELIIKIKENEVELDCHEENLYEYYLNGSECKPYPNKKVKELVINSRKELRNLNK